MHRTTRRPACTARRAAPLAVLCAACCALASPAWAQDAPRPPDAAQPASQPPQPTQFRLGGDHPTLRVGDLEVVFRARLETSFRTSSPVDEGVDADWRRRRIQVEGSYKRLEYEVSHEFGDPQEPERDAFVNFPFSRRFELQAGRFKMPFGRDALNSGANIDFVHRSLTGRQLAPGRDIGVMAHGRLADNLTYDAGYFLHDGDNARAPSAEGGSHAVAGRIELQPFNARKDSALEPLEIGVAVVGSQLDDVLALRGETVFGDGNFFDRVFANGRRLRIGVDAEWSRGPYGLSGEFVRSADARKGMGIDGDDLPGVGATGWYASGTWVVTGERKRARVEPRKSVLDGGLGAIELAARLERLSFGDVVYPVGGFGPRPEDLLGNSEWVSTVGVTWFATNRFKVQGNLIFESISDAGRSPAPRDGGRFTSGVVNLQFVL
jgi:phosphate-selective porin OprO and OprP